MQITVLRLTMTGLSKRAIMSRLIRRSLLKAIKSKAQLSFVFESYPFLGNHRTRIHIRRSKVFFIMRGLPGSGKSTTVRAIKLQYKNALVVSADNYFSLEDGSYEFSKDRLSEAHENCRKVAEQAAKKGLRHVVVDNTNIMRWEMGEYFRLAGLYNYVVLLVEPRTPWAMDAAALAAKNTHGVSEEHIRLKMKKFGPVFPVYWAWFLNECASKQLLSLGENAFNICIANVPEFSNYMNEQAFAKGCSLPISFQDYYQRDSGKIPLMHCTAFYSGHGKHRHPKTDEYASGEEVKSSTGRAFDLKLVAVMITPRTVGMRVVLNRKQLALWGGEDVWRPIVVLNSESKASESGEPSSQQKEVVVKSKTDKPRKMKKSEHTVKAVKNSAGGIDIDDISFSLGDSIYEESSDEILVAQSINSLTLMSSDCSYSDPSNDAQFKSVVETSAGLGKVQQFCQDKAVSDSLLDTECPCEVISEVDLSVGSLSQRSNENSEATFIHHLEPSKQMISRDAPCKDTVLQSECTSASLNVLNVRDCSGVDEVSSQSLPAEISNSPCFQHPCPSGHVKEVNKFCEIAELEESEHSSEISLERGSRAHITLGVAKGYEAVHTGLDQMELLICEENGSLVGEPIVTSNVTILHYGEGRCAVYFDWPIYKSALFTGKY